MNIKYQIKSVPGKGKGIFAIQKVRQGKVWWSPHLEQNIVYIPDSSLNQYFAEKTDSEISETLEYMFCSGQFCIDIMNSDAKFTNHSKNPNSYVNENGESVALRDIQIGQEITENYRTFGITRNWNLLMKKYKTGNWAELSSIWDSQLADL